MSKRAAPKSYLLSATYILSFIFVSFFPTVIIGQNVNFEWVKTAGNTGFDIGKLVIIDRNKYVISAGEFLGQVDFDFGPGTYNLTETGNQRDIFISKIDTGGNFIWAKQIGGNSAEELTSITNDKQGNIYITGIFQNTVDFDPGPGIVNMSSIFISTFLLKLDTNGNFIWVKQLPNRVESITLDEVNDLVLTGYFSGTKDFDPGPGTFTISTNSLNTIEVFVLKLDSAGNFIWVKQLPTNTGTYSEAFAVKTDQQENIYVSGSFGNIVDFDPGSGVFTQTSNGVQDIFVLKLDKNGSFIWAKQMGGTYSDRSFSMELDSAGNIYTTGWFQGTTDFDPGPGLFLLSTSSIFYVNAYISKLDNNGNFVYAKQLLSATASTAGRAVTVDRKGDVYFGGEFDLGQVDFDPGPGTLYYGTVFGGIYITKLDAGGNFIWTKIFEDNGGPLVRSITTDILRNIYVTGEFGSTVDFDPNPPVYNSTVNGLQDIFILKLSQCNSTLDNIQVNTCGDYILNGITYSAPGLYYQFFTNATSCDSIIQLDLSIGNIFNQITVNACSSYSWNGQLLTTSGIYRDTTRLSNGCDSITNLNLTITRITNNLNASACGSYLWKGSLLTNSGIYRDTIRLVNGCDSVVILNLVINQKPMPRLGADTILCKPGTIVLSPGTFNQYQWSNNSTGSTLHVTDTGTYWVNVTASNNCSARDTIVIRKSDQCGCALNDQTKIYANPFTSSLIVDKNTTSCEVRMNLYNGIGQLILKDKIINDGINVLQLGKLSPGMYFYVFHADGNILLKGNVIKL